MDFKGLVALVTGGAQGIGKSYCLSLLDLGMKVCVCDINENTGKKFVDEVPDVYKDKVMFSKCDVSSREDFKASFGNTLKSFGRIDVVVNNAGIINEPEWEKVVAINFIGVIHGIQLAFEYMSIGNGGRGGFVINTASNTGLEPFSIGPVYSGCKHGVVGLTISYGCDFHFKRTGVTVNAVCPGPVYSELYHVYPALTVDEEYAKQQRTTIKTIRPDDVAKALVQLLKDGKNGSLLRVGPSGTLYHTTHLEEL